MNDDDCTFFPEWRGTFNPEWWRSGGGEITLGGEIAFDIETYCKNDVALTALLQPTPTKEPTMPAGLNTIEFRIHYIGPKFVSLIRVFRAATGAGLLQAKTLIEASRMGPGPFIRLTSAQYGDFIANILTSSDVELKEVRMSALRVLPNNTLDVYDFANTAA